MRIGLVLMAAVAMLGVNAMWFPAEPEAQAIACPRSNPFCAAPKGWPSTPILDPYPDRICGDPSSVSLTATPATIRQGQSAIVQWAVTYPYKCSPPAITLNGRTVGLQGSMTVTPMATSPYGLFIGPKSAAAVTVSVVLPAVVRIKGSTAEWKQLLIQALSTPHSTVLLAHNVDMDLSYYQNINITQGVTLTSEAPPAGTLQGVALAGFAAGPVADRGPVARNAFSLGPRIYTTTRPRPLFHIRCNGVTGEGGIHGDGVRLSGFRLQGPHWDTMEGDDNLEFGIMVTSCTGVEISNMEISGWSGVGIYISDPVERIAAFEDVKVFDSFFHHNQHQGGNGYGIDVAAGSRATIERNLFDFNRHAIAAAGVAGTGYRANWNLVLKGGGVHDGTLNYYTHQFDVHGDAHCPDIPFYDGEDWYTCGNAGDAFQYIGNTFQFTNDLAIKIRGTPRFGAAIVGNVFAHDDVDDAVAPTDDNKVEIYGNGTGMDHYGQYGVCDVDGDRRDDLFMATGVSWWYSSGGRREWRFLNAQPGTLSSLGLGDFDGDGRCDVFRVSGREWQISRGGTSAFASLGTFDVPFDELAFGDFNGDNRKDIFRRAPDTQWYAISPGVYPWTPLASSGFALSALRFGDFDANGITDVAAVTGGRWAVSWNARQSWQTLNSSMSSSLAPLFIADVDGIPGDDIVRFVRENEVSARWEAASGGAGPWFTLARIDYPDTEANRDADPTGAMKTFVGNFDGWNGVDVVALDSTRRSYLFSPGNTAGFTPYGLYQY